MSDTGQCVKCERLTDNFNVDILNYLCDVCDWDFHVWCRNTKRPGEYFTDFMRKPGTPMHNYRRETVYIRQSGRRYLTRRQCRRIDHKFNKRYGKTHDYSVTDRH